jgi:hypothetical protein
MELSEQATTWIGAAVSILVTAIFIHFGAGFVIRGKRHYGQAVAVAFFGSMLASIVLMGAGFGALGIFLGLAAWALVAAFVYRATWLAGLFIGVAAWLIWWLMQFLMRTLFGA